MISNKNKKSNEKLKKRVPKTVQNTIKYLSIFDDGIMEVEKGKYSKAIKFNDINYQIARQDDQEEIFMRYCNTLNYFDYDIQINIFNKKVNQEDFKNSILLKEKGDNLDIYRKEYNNILNKQENDTEKFKQLVITIEAKNIKEARTTFTRIESECIANFKKMGSHAEAMDGKERLEIIHDFFIEDEKMYYPENVGKVVLDSKNLIAPESFLFKKDYFMIGDKYARTFFLKEFASFMNDTVITEFTNALNDKLSMLNMNIQPLPSEKALRLVQRQLTGMESNKIDYQKRSLQNGYLEAFIPYDLKYALEEAQEMLDDILNKNQKLFFTSLTITHIADTKEELDEDSKNLNSIASKLICKLGVLNYQQEDGLNSCLPLGNNKLKISRTLTTESLAVFVPFTNQELLQKDGCYYGINAVSKNLILFDRKSLKNYNGFILGTPGSGKSFSAKREITNVLLNTDDDVIIIDPEREYAPMAQNFGGEIIHISAGSKNYINPMDLPDNHSEEDDPMLLKSEFILGLCECLIGGLSAKDKTLIDRCLKLTYNKYASSGFDKKYLPTLLDFQEVLERQEEKEAKDLAVELELYTKGSLSIFANKTNVNINNRLVVYDIKDLKKQLKTMGMLIVLDAVWNKITENRSKGKKTWIYMDEIYLLFNNEYSANFLFELYKRARKWGGIPTGITQNVEDLLKSDLAKRMLSNSDFILMLNQSTSDRNELAKLLNISETQLGYITNVDEGEGLLFSGKNIIPFVDKFPKNTKLYQMMTTKVDEVALDEITETKSIERG